MTYLNEQLRRHVLVPLFAILFAAGLVSMSGCDMLGLSDFVGGSDDSGTARMQVLLVDNPFPFDLVSEVNVTISHVELRNDETKLTISDEPRTFQLLELQNGVSAELGDVELPVGTYHEARLTVDDANIVLNDGQVFDLKVPSGRIKVLLHDVAVESGQDVSLTLDFDVSKSFVVQGNPNTPAGIKGFIMKPTVISKGMKDNGRGDDDDDGEDEEEEEEDEEDVEEREVSGVVTAITTVDASTFITVDGLDLMITADTEFEGAAGVDALVVDESVVEVEYFEDAETTTLIATKVEVEDSGDEGEEDEEEEEGGN